MDLNNEHAFVSIEVADGEFRLYSATNASEDVNVPAWIDVGFAVGDGALVLSGHGYLLPVSAVLHAGVKLGVERLAQLNTGGRDGSAKAGLQGYWMKHGADGKPLDKERGRVRVRKLKGTLRYHANVPTGRTRILLNTRDISSGGRTLALELELTLRRLRWR